ncbi:MAG TPA: nicotinate phosphoribosyltransferase [Actinomycetota bacterium]|nr:nicotinate phosphoribosyltransferase [Actinomycetota bacterium]
MGRALLTDLYELNMAASYLQRGMTGPATFSLFIRGLPRGWGFFVASGLGPALEWLRDLRFEEEDLAYLRGTHGYPDDVLDRFRDLRFTGEVRAVPEGRVVFPNAPLLEVTAPLPEAQLAESFLLNQITYQTAVASKAARCVLAAPDREMVDFSFRRVHGVDAGMAVARATAIAGFAATSNVEAARLLGLRATGTMAHSYIEAFVSEEAAFRAFAEDFPDSVVLLVDTYDTARGVRTAIEVGRELEGRGLRLAAIRLDSGDLAVLARDAREALDAAGLREVRIIASGGLDEHRVADLASAPIDAFGIGSKVGVASDAPYLDSVYKLVEYEGRPVVKLSTGKATLPGRKQVWRTSGGDVVGLMHEPAPTGGEPLLVEVMRDGAIVGDHSLAAARDRFRRERDWLPQALRALDADPLAVRRTEALDRLTERVREEIRAGARG